MPFNLNLYACCGTALQLSIYAWLLFLQLNYIAGILASLMFVYKNILSSVGSCLSGCR